jgi:membrane-bound lytic murein transglycosylase D
MSQDCLQRFLRPGLARTPIPRFEASMRHRLAALLSASLLAGCAHLPATGGGEMQSPEAGTLAEVPSPLPLPGDASGERERKEFVDLFQRMRAGFALPHAENPSVRREIEWFEGHAGYLDRTFARGQRYLHYIVETLEQRSMPRELALLPVIESAFDPFARSRCRAVGLWQFIPETGRRYGLDQDWWRDDRRDVLEATRAALDHLADLHEAFAGDWLLALAAYNAGELTVMRAVERNRRLGRPIDFFALDLPDETRSYVPRLLAISRLVAEPEAFGVEIPAIPNAPYFVRVDLDGQIDLGRLADRARIPREELRALNPTFNRWVTAPGGPHRLLVPALAKERIESVIASLPPSERLRLLHHRVQRGDTLAAIARQHGIALEALRAANRLRGSRLHAGQDILVPLHYGAGIAIGG